MSSIILNSLQAWLPEAILCLGALIVSLLGAWVSFGSKEKPKQNTLIWILAWSSILGACIALSRLSVPPPTDTFFGLIICDKFSFSFRWLSLGVTAIVALMLMDSKEITHEVRGEALGLVLFIAVGMMLMAQANNLLMAYVAIELVSLSSYMLVGFMPNARSHEASLKYLLYGALASGVMLFGMSMLFGLTGKIDFTGILGSLSISGSISTSALMSAFACIFVGIAFKISMVPFHMWTPDAYEGAPIPVTALLSVGPKAAGLALFIRLIDVTFPAWSVVAPVLLVLTIITITFGNIVALVQTNIKRLLAYSTIAQVGYILIGVVAGSELGRQAVIIYLVAYLFMNLGVFAAVVAVERSTGSESIEAFRGLSKRAPVLALLTAVFLLSLAGIPPLLGFLGKFLLFKSAWVAQYNWLVVAGIINSAIALYYYVNIIRFMYITDEGGFGRISVGLPTRVAICVCGIGTVLLGIFPGDLLSSVAAFSAVALR